MEDLVDIQTEVQRRSIEDLYTDQGSDVGMEKHVGRYEEHVGKGQRMEKAYGGGMVTKGDMWDNIVTMKGHRYAMESELTKRR